MSKPRGINAGRKLRSHRKLQRWADKRFKRVRLSASLKADPLSGSSHAKGLVVSQYGITAKQPNSGVRKCVRVQLKKNQKVVSAFVPGDGNLAHINDRDRVLISGFGRSGKAVGDIPGVRFKVVSVNDCALVALYRGKATKGRA
eukprot:TRINITY_DN3124_c0_g2_i2.p1 TRINITY_DN3124_c0_g2~~TRINITY_DN3124_c0_g2_i2.p1  ORF type:complete len:144 (+),score=24.23 TRINITY_DN3124_c0_g2_i2:33-464(+)